MLCATALVGGCTQATPSTGGSAQAGLSQSISADAKASDDHAVMAPADMPSDGPPASEAQVALANHLDSPASPVTRETRQVAKPVVGGSAATVPPVLLSAGHSKLCTVNVGDVIPTMELPKLGGGRATLDSLAGQTATVVLFWTNDAWMSATALGDLGRIAGNDNVSLVGIAVGLSADVAKPILDKAKANFPQLLDQQGTGVVQVGENALPRIYVLDGQRRIAWFDIEYSEATRREVHLALEALTGAAR
jgi:hypothetical protein